MSDTPTIQSPSKCNGWRCSAAILAFACAALSLWWAGKAIVQEGRESRALAIRIVEHHATTVRKVAKAGIPKNSDSTTNSAVTPAPVAMEGKDFADSTHPLALLGLGVGGLVLGLTGMSFALRRDEE